MSTTSVGIVVIGRNEGERLKRCIRSITDQASLIVYVDSGSTDGSAEWAQEQGVDLLNLDMSQPFTAARARNAGFTRLTQLNSSIEFVQFVDGDCEVAEGWIGAAMQFMESHKDVAVVCGRRRELYPEHSVYNQFCDIEWNTPVGKALSCGGDAMMRTDVFKMVSGYRPDLIAGEEPELCVRIRATEHKVWRIDREMTLHDANIKHFSQWWKRTARCGYAYALGASIHGSSSERFRVKETMRMVFWGAVLPGSIVLGLVLYPPLLLLIAVYPVQYIRLLFSGKRMHFRLRSQWALFSLLGKFPEFYGSVKFVFDRLLKRRGKIMEYK